MFLNIFFVPLNCETGQSDLQHKRVVKDNASIAEKCTALVVLLTADVIIGMLHDVIVHISEPHLVGAHYCCNCPI